MKFRFRPKRRRRKKKAKPSPSSRRQVVRDRARAGLAILPSMLTLGNLICGFFAIVHVGAVQWQGGEPIPGNAFTVAAAAILVAMVFDMLDGRVARMTNSTSEFGAQLDSLADAITFGVAPGVLVAMLHAMGRYDGALPFWSKMAWVFGAAYACAAVIRLARFNVETASHEESAHMAFKGLPSPAAAGVIATLVVLQGFLKDPTPRLTAIDPALIKVVSQRILDVMPFVTLGLGYLMVSKFQYVHVANKYLKGRKPAEYLTGAAAAILLVVLLPEIAAAVAFCGFALSGPVIGFRDWMVGDDSEPEAAEVASSADSVADAPPDPA